MTKENRSDSLEDAKKLREEFLGRFRTPRFFVLIDKYLPEYQKKYGNDLSKEEFQKQIMEFWYLMCINIMDFDNRDDALQRQSYINYKYLDFIRELSDGEDLDVGADLEKGKINVSFYDDALAYFKRHCQTSSDLMQILNAR